MNKGALQNSCTFGSGMKTIMHKLRCIKHDNTPIEIKAKDSSI